MTEQKPSPPESRPDRTVKDIREDAGRLQKKVRDLSDSLDRIEKTLEEAAEGRNS